MSAAHVIKVIAQREERDCAIVALAMYLGCSYEDVLRVTTTTDRYQGRRGLWTRTMTRIAGRLGHDVRVRKRFDIESDYGILLMPAHAVVVRNGLVIDGDGTVWDADAFLLHHAVPVDECELLEVRE